MKAADSAGRQSDNAIGDASLDTIVGKPIDRFAVLLQKSATPSRTGIRATTPANHVIRAWRSKY